MNDERYTPEDTDSHCSFPQRPLLVHLEQSFRSNRGCVPGLSLVLHGCDTANTPAHQNGPHRDYLKYLMDRTVTEDVWEQGAEEDIWTEEEWSDGRMEKIA
jgi:hypothetical protein